MNPSNVSPPSTPASSAAPASTPPGASGGSAGEGGTTAMIKDKARQAVDQARGATTQIKDKAAEMVGERRAQVADRIGSYSSAIRNTGQSLENDDPNIAWLTQQAADRLQHVADYVRERDFQGLRADAEDLARRHPTLLLGGMFIAGLFVGTALKAGATAAASTADTGQTGDLPQDYDYDPDTAPGDAFATSSPATAESNEI